MTGLSLSSGSTSLHIKELQTCGHATYSPVRAQIAFLRLLPTLTACLLCICGVLCCVFAVLCCAFHVAARLLQNYGVIVASSFTGLIRATVGAVHLRRTSAPIITVL
jgi:hypothetical protein